ncbi:MAG TPA: hypothetical protein VHM28_02745, partial [Anaerolineales bacterium]|nr:hypothetical protein [Anaerolineales bacterium]
MIESSTPPKRSLLSIIFLSPSEPRLRPIWRLSIQTILLFVIGILAGIPVTIIGYALHIEGSSTVAL